jgi:hypothetical protein
VVVGREREGEVRDVLLFSSLQTRVGQEKRWEIELER